MERVPGVKGSNHEKDILETGRGRRARSDRGDRGDSGFGELPAFGGLSALDSCHPSIPAAFFALALVLTMAAVQPVLAAISLACAILCAVRARGLRDVARSLLWQIPLIVLVAVANPLFSASGSTVLFRFGYTSVYLESLCYGAVMGTLLVSVTVWFQAASSVLTSDKVMAVLGRRLPLVSLMVSMALRLVPRFVERGREISLVHDACTSRSACRQGARLSAGGRMGRIPSDKARQVSVLMGWSMEDSLETADAMKARGWGRDVRRTCYRRWRMTVHDIVWAGILACLELFAVAVAWAATTQFGFYPVMSELRPWWGYAVYAAFFLFPLLMQGEEALRWRR